MYQEGWGNQGNMMGQPFGDGFSNMGGNDMTSFTQTQEEFSTSEPMGMGMGMGPGMGMGMGPGMGMGMGSGMGMGMDSGMGMGMGMGGDSCQETIDRVNETTEVSPFGTTENVVSEQETIQVNQSDQNFGGFNTGNTEESVTFTETTVSDQSNNFGAPFDQNMGGFGQPSFDNNFQENVEFNAMGGGFNDF